MAKASNVVGEAQIPCHTSTSFLLTRIPPEVRYDIFDRLLNSHHIILITPNSKQRGVLKPLVQVCKQLRDDMQKWLMGKKESAIIISPTFGVFKNEVTTFKMCWVDEFSLLFQKGLYVRKDGSCTLQRCYIPRHPARDLERLEMWQRAMDLEGTNRRSRINSVLQYQPQFKGYITSLDDRKLLGWQIEDWCVLDPKEHEFLPMVLGRPLKQFVWSNDFEAHAEYQEYTRQHPREDVMLRRVECGPAFEFKFDGDFDLIEVG
ncbi:uncharacterized protein K444DRAFT_699879 [Hyaloscypha bicolor E]|uniref:Uncharacterized protein n=1 Tax=Hyaloscypha bicolor E TaxID=1095630 RepID=A0A2J6STY7_9HELO|nr:uncharacterized protein K444DRAFT_699879 [Hyaloscypha bicolor E]PMD54163.1 hypothetical protein K444DRAFT_699879 [Hyaloscypha bicolor E]